MTQTPPIIIAREADRGWRQSGCAIPTAGNDNVAGGGHCPSCEAPGLIAPAASQYRGNGLIHHNWLCRSCGHEWTTKAHIPIS